jgi:hypothetical protein
MMLWLLQVVALCQAPFLLDDPNVGLIFPADAIARAKHYLAMAPGGLGNILSNLFVPKFQRSSSCTKLGSSFAILLHMQVDNKCKVVKF